MRACSGNIPCILREPIADRTDVYCNEVREKKNRWLNGQTRKIFGGRMGKREKGGKEKRKKKGKEGGKKRREKKKKG